MSTVSFKDRADPLTCMLHSLYAINHLWLQNLPISWQPACRATIFFHTFPRGRRPALGFEPRLITHSPAPLPKIWLHSIYSISTRIFFTWFRTIGDSMPCCSVTHFCRKDPKTNSCGRHNRTGVTTPAWHLWQFPSGCSSYPPQLPQTTCLNRKPQSGG